MFLALLLVVLCRRSTSLLHSNRAMYGAHCSVQPGLFYCCTSWRGCRLHLHSLAPACLPQHSHCSGMLCIVSVLLKATFSFRVFLTLICVSGRLPEGYNQRYLSSRHLPLSRSLLLVLMPENFLLSAPVHLGTCYLSKVVYQDSAWGGLRCLQLI